MSTDRCMISVEGCKAYLSLFTPKCSPPCPSKQPRRLQRQTLQEFVPGIGWRVFSDTMAVTPINRRLRLSDAVFTPTPWQQSTSASADAHPGQGAASCATVQPQRTATTVPGSASATPTTSSASKGAARTATSVVQQASGPPPRASGSSAEDKAPAVSPPHVPGMAARILAMRAGQPVVAVAATSSPARPSPKSVLSRAHGQPPGQEALPPGKATHLAKGQAYAAASLPARTGASSTKRKAPAPHRSMTTKDKEKKERASFVGKKVTSS